MTELQDPLDRRNWYQDTDPDYEAGAAAMATAYEEGRGDGPMLLKIGMDAALGITEGHQEDTNNG